MGSFIVVAVLITGAVSGNDTAGADRAYLSRLAAPARDSQAVGAALTARLGSSTLTQAELDSALSVLVQRQARDTAAASVVTPAPTLRGEHAHAREALQLRLDGLKGLLAGFRSAGSSGKSGWAAALAAEADRLVASDVIWHDLFETPTRAQLARDGAKGTHVPQSVFVTDLELAGSQSMAAVLGRLLAPASQTASTVKLGDFGPQVAAWQQQLNRWLSRQPGHPTLKVTGTFDQATAGATIQLQTAAHITPDGIAGPATHAALSKALPS